MESTKHISTAFNGSRFAVTWCGASSGIRASILNTNRTLLTDSITVNSSQQPRGDYLQVCAAGSNFLLVYFQNYAFGSPYGVKAIRLSEDGTVLDTTPILLSASTESDIGMFDVIADGNDWIVFYVTQDGENIPELRAAQVSSTGTVTDLGLSLDFGLDDCTWTNPEMNLLSCVSSGDYYFIAWSLVKAVVDSSSYNTFGSVTTLDSSFNIVDRTDLPSVNLSFRLEIAQDSSETTMGTWSTGTVRLPFPSSPPGYYSDEKTVVGTLSNLVPVELSVFTVD